jgi:hypothetical protein
MDYWEKHQILRGIMKCLNSNCVSNSREPVVPDFCGHMTEQKEISTQIDKLSDEERVELWRKNVPLPSIRISDAESNLGNELPLVQILIKDEASSLKKEDRSHQRGSTIFHKSSVENIRRVGHSKGGLRTTTAVYQSR